MCLMGTLNYKINFIWDMSCASDCNSFFFRFLSQIPCSPVREAELGGPVELPMSKLIYKRVNYGVMKRKIIDRY